MLPYLSTCPYPPKSSTIRSTSSSFGTFVGPRSPTSHRPPSANARPDDPGRRTSRRRLVPTETRRRPGNTTRGPPYDAQHRQTALTRSLRRGLCSCNYSAQSVVHCAGRSCIRSADTCNCMAHTGRGTNRKWEAGGQRLHGNSSERLYCGCTFVSRSARLGLRSRCSSSRSEVTLERRRLDGLAGGGRRWIGAYSCRRSSIMLSFRSISALAVENRTLRLRIRILFCDSAN